MIIGGSSMAPGRGGEGVGGEGVGVGGERAAGLRRRPSSGRRQELDLLGVDSLDLNRRSGSLVTLLRRHQRGAACVGLG